MFGKFFILGNHDFIDNAPFIRSQISSFGFEDVTNKKINMIKELVMSVGNFDIYQIVEGNFPDAYVLTKGIPFASLKIAFPNPRILNEISGIVVNIGHKGYIPSQARTKIKMNREDEASIIEMIDACNFVFSLKQFIKHKLTFFF